jgi:PAS domain S-box-containing protein
MAETLEVRRAKPAKLQKVAPRRTARLGRSERPPSSDAASRELLAAVPAAVYTTDAKGYITYYNEAAAKLWGCRPELGVSQWCGSWRLYRADGTPLPHDECPMADALKSQHPVRDVEAILERPDGVRVPFIPYPTPLIDAEGTMTGAINVLVDISERQRAQEANQRLAAIVESSDDAIISKDLNGIIATWNHGAQRLFGYAAEDVIGKPIQILIPADRQSEEPEIIGRIVRGERIDHYDTVRRRKDGSLVEISLTVSPIRNASGTIIGASKIARDISERKRAEARQKALLDELNHRVKNTLATVQSLAAQSIRGAGVSQSIRQSFEDRLFALSRAHDQLSRTQWETADLRSILEDIFAPYCQSDRLRVRLEGARVHLEPETALMLAMVLHELATNAAKYGSLAGAEGKLNVSWSVANGMFPPRLKIDWSETGGPQVHPPTRRGFGSRLLDRAINQQLGGTAEIAFEPTGVRCQIEIPFAYAGAHV